MDRGDQMASLSGSASYYMSRGLPGAGNQHELLSSASIRQLSNTNNLPFQSGIAGGGGGTIGSTLPMDSSGISSQSINVGGPSGGAASTGEPGKRKRGRPRKYGADGSVSLALTPTTPASQPGSGSGSGSQVQKRGRGRPPGSGKKQQLASVGGLISSSAGNGFAPHVINIAIGEDIATKILAFSQQGPRAIFVMSANGAVSTVTLCQASTSGGSVTYEGRFEILSLTGSYLVADNNGLRNRTGSLSVTLASPDGRVIGGGVGGLLIAASPVQVIVGSFLWGGQKAKNKKNEDSENQEAGVEQDPHQHPHQHQHQHHHHGVHNPVAVNSISPNQNLTPSSLNSWPASRPLDMRNSHMDIDLMRG